MNEPMLIDNAFLEDFASRAAATRAYQLWCLTSCLRLCCCQTWTSRGRGRTGPPVCQQPCQTSLWPGTVGCTRPLMSNGGSHSLPALSIISIDWSHTVSRTSILSIPPFPRAFHFQPLPPSFSTSSPLSIPLSFILRYCCSQ